MKIVLVNDDGIDSKRLHIAEEVLLQLADEVFVVAPAFEQSAKSMALTPKSFSYTKRDDNHYAVNGTPVDCVNFAIHGLNLNPDIVVSGINNGFNLGIDIYYSGTVGAAFQAQYFGYPAVALSADYKFSGDLKKVTEFTFKQLLDEQLISSDYVININFPPNIVDSSYKETIPGKFISTLDGEMANDLFTYKRKIIVQPRLENSDYTNYMNGYITLSKLELRLK